jgi:hypothetical protein
MPPAAHSAMMQLIISIFPAIPSHFTRQFMAAWVEVGQTTRLTRIHAPSSIYIVNSRHGSEFAIFTWHERGNAFPAMNRTFSEIQSKQHVFRRWRLTRSASGENHSQDSQFKRHDEQRILALLGIVTMSSQAKY